MFKNVASQKIQVYAYDASAGTPKTGDAANITVYVSKDNGAVTVLGDTSATEMDATNAAGVYLFDLTQGETNADYLVFTGKSSTSNIKIAPQFIYTFPPNFTTAAIDGSGQVTVGAIANNAITASSIATDAITAAKIAADAIGASELAADAVTEIQSGLSTLTQANVRTAVGLGSANLDTQLAAIQADTDDIQTRIPAALSGGNMKVDILAINTDTTAAANIAKTTRAIGRGTASGVPTTTSIPTSACTPAGAVADQFKGRIITFDADTATTALRGQATDITASSNAATPTFTVTALTTAPAAGDTFSIS